MTESTDNTAPQQLGGWKRVALEFGPLLVFYLTFVKWGIFYATGVFMVAILISIPISYKLQGHVSKMLLFTAAVVMVMGGLTLWLQNETFFKLKPTIIYVTFSCILFFGLARGRSYLQLVMDAGMPNVAEAGWKIFTRNFALFFLAMAGVNEFVWRSYSTDTWVDVKTFGFLPLTFLFILTQMPILMKHQEEEGGNDAAENDQT